MFKLQQNLFTLLHQSQSNQSNQFEASAVSCCFYPNKEPEKVYYRLQNNTKLKHIDFFALLEIIDIFRQTKSKRLHSDLFSALSLKGLLLPSGL